MKVVAKKELRVARIKKGLTAYQMADHTGLTHTGYRQMERRVNGISPAKAKTVCEVLNLDFEKLFELVDRKPSTRYDKKN